MTPFTQLFFAYGTLRYQAKIDKIVGRHLAGKSASLPGYRKKYDGSYAYLEKVTSLAPVSVPGVVYEVTDSDLAKLDRWEEKYERVKVRLSDGRMATTFEKKSHPEE
jgi:gamma-glutamylcyclotransferase (GGCT)/AIG2-like uncharacterized protein YtfP